MIILVTGCSGFIGSHLCEKLLASHMTNISSSQLPSSIYVIGVDNMNTYYDIEKKKDNLKLLQTYPNFFFFEQDVLHISHVFRELKKKNKLPQVVIHLAGLAGVRHSLHHPESYITTNVIGFISLIQECNFHKIKTILYASSSSVYGLNEDYPFSEEDPLNNMNSPYAISKKCMEDFAKMYSRMYELQIIGMRFFTVYGPRGRPDMSPFKFLKSIRDNNTLKLYGDSNCLIRDFTFVGDLIDGIIKLIERRSRLKNEEIFNFGSGHPISLTTFIETCEKVVGKKAKLSWEEKQEGDVPKTFANIAKAQSLLDFYPKKPLFEGLSDMLKTLNKKPIRLVPLSKTQLQKETLSESVFSKNTDFKEKITKKIIFLSQYPQLGSNYLRGNQICDSLNNLGLDCEMLEIQQGKGKVMDNNDPQLCEIKNCIVILISRYRHNIVLRLKKNNNIIVFDMVDKFCELNNQIGQCQQIVNNVDVIIFPNKKTEHDFNTLIKGNFKSVVIHHHWDPRLKNMVTNFPNDQLVFGFMGSVATANKNCIFLYHLIHNYKFEVLDTELCKYMTEDVKKGKISDIWKWIDRLVENNICFNCHVSIRKKDSLEWKYKTNTKVSTAAFFESPIITTQEDTLSEILPNDYPYFIKDTSKESVFRAFDYVQSTFNTNVWEKAKDIMKSVKEKLSIEYLSYNYLELFENLQKTKTQPNKLISNKENKDENNKSGENDESDKCISIHTKHLRKIIFVESLSQLGHTLSLYQKNSSRKFALYTVNINGYDNFIDIDEKNISPHIDYFYLTDLCPSVFSNVESNWNIICFKNDEGWDNYLLSRILKVCCEKYFYAYTASIYIDSNVRINNDSYPLLYDTLIMRNYDMGVFKHPQRNKLYEEFQRIFTKNANDSEDKKTKLKEQYAYYKNCNYENENSKFQLTWNNILIRKHNARVKKLMDHWFEQITRFNQRDQLSFLFSWWCNNSCLVHILPLQKDKFPLVAEYKDKNYPYFSHLNFYFSRPLGGEHNK